MRRTVFTAPAMALALLAFLTSAPSGVPSPSVPRPRGAESRDVQFVVAAPDQASSPAASIYCSLACDRWPAGGRELPRVAPGLYAATLNLPVGEALEYKFVRERNWTTVEKGPQGEELSNRTLTLERDAGGRIVFHAIASWADRPDDTGPTATFNAARDGRAAAGDGSRRATRTGDIRVHRAFESPQLGNRRTLWVYLPPDYEQDVAARYPVLYVHDGQNVFDAATSFQGVEWGLDETAERLIAARRLSPLIIVAIENTPGRLNEYTCVADVDRGGGRGDAYLAFLVKTVKPFVDRTYRTRPEREHTGIAGSSLGGLISLYAAVRHPDVFGRIGVISPAVFWAGGAAVADVRAAHVQRPLRIWLDIGTAEGGDVAAASRAVAGCGELRAALLAAGLQPDAELVFEIVAGGRHHERDWAARSERILLHLFPAP